MKKLLLVVLALALAGPALAQDAGIEYRPPGGGSVTPGSTPVAGCTNVAIVGNGSAVLDCDTDANWIARQRRTYRHWIDFEAGSPVLYSAIVQASGTSTQTGTADRPGIRVTNSSNSANSGVVWIFNSSGGFLLHGGEHFEIAFSPSRFTDVVFRAGFHDGTGQTAPVDGCWLSIDTTGLITGVCSSNSSTTTTNTSFQTVLDTWYRGAVHVEASAASVTFTLYSTADAVLWTNSVAATIPTGAGRETAAGLQNIYTQAGLTTALSQVDWMAVASGPLAR